MVHVENCAEKKDVPTALSSFLEANKERPLIELVTIKLFKIFCTITKNLHNFFCTLFVEDSQACAHTPAHTRRRTHSSIKQIRQNAKNQMPYKSSNIYYL